MEKCMKNDGYGHVLLRLPFKVELAALAFASITGRQRSGCQPLPALPWLSKTTLPNATFSGGGTYPHIHAAKIIFSFRSPCEVGWESARVFTEFWNSPSCWSHSCPSSPQLSSQEHFLVMVLNANLCLRVIVIDTKAAAYEWIHAIKHHAAIKRTNYGRGSLWMLGEESQLWKGTHYRIPFE